MWRESHPSCDGGYMAVPWDGQTVPWRGSSGWRLSISPFIIRRLGEGRSARVEAPEFLPKRKGEMTMRFMMLMIPKGYEQAVAGTMPPAEAVAAMMKYNESLQKAGVLLALDGLHPPAMGARVSFAGGKPKVTDGPFTEAKEAIISFALIDVRSREEAIELARRFWQIARNGEGAIRQVYGPE